MPPLTQRQRADERRRVKLEQVEEQIRSGSLTVRQMTPEERARSLARPPRPARRTRAR